MRRCGFPRWTAQNRDSHGNGYGRFNICSPLFPVKTILLLCPLLGIALNGTSSVLYGSVPELVAYESRNYAFAVFYTFTIGVGALSPSLYGIVGDHFGVLTTLTIVAAIATGTIPLTIPLRGRLARY